MTTGSAGDLHALRERVDDLDTMIQAAVDALDSRLTALENAPAPAPAAAAVTPRRWAARATTEQWTQLVAFVDGLILDYSLALDRVIRPCWPAHPGVVEELWSLYQAWTLAVLTDELNTGTDQHPGTGCTDLNIWHDKALHPTLERLQAKHYRMSSCTGAHTPETRTATLTDRALVPTTPRPH